MLRDPGVLNHDMINNSGLKIGVRSAGFWIRISVITEHKGGGQNNNNVLLRVGFSLGLDSPEQEHLSGNTWARTAKEHKAPSQSWFTPNPLISGPFLLLLEKWLLTGSRAASVFRPFWSQTPFFCDFSESDFNSERSEPSWKDLRAGTSGQERVLQPESCWKTFKTTSYYTFHWKYWRLTDMIWLFYDRTRKSSLTPDGENLLDL